MTGDVYTEIGSAVRTRIAGVALFGDPKFNSADPSGQGGFRRGVNGAFLARKLFPGDTRGRVQSYCHKRDPVCQIINFAFPFDWNAHKDYGALGEPQKAAKYLVRNT